MDPSALLDFATAAYVSSGMPDEAARLCADTLVQADLWGHSSHGVMRLPWYIRRLQSGVCDPAAMPELMLDGGALALVDGHDAMGPVVAMFACREAVRRARAHGIGAVSVRNSNHFGTAMYFTIEATREGCIGFLSSNASPAMAPWGGRRKAVGTNPWSWAAPAGEMAPLVLDIANTGAARGKIYLARQKGQSIPLDWALDEDGRPTADPARALDGLIQPMARHKGYAIALMMDVLSGVLSGSAFGSAVAGPYQAERRSGAGHMMIAIDVEKLMPLEAFVGRIRDLVAELKRVPLAAGSDEILYPGEAEHRSERRSRASGLLLPADTIRDLAQLARAQGLPELVSP